MTDLTTPEGGTTITSYRGYRIYQDRDFDQNTTVFYFVDIELEDKYDAAAIDTGCASLDEVKALIDEVVRRDNP